MRFEGRGQAGCALRCRDPIAFGQTDHKMWLKRLWSNFGQTDHKTFDLTLAVAVSGAIKCQTSHHVSIQTLFLVWVLQTARPQDVSPIQITIKIITFCLPMIAVLHCFTIWPPTVWHSMSSDLSDMKLHCSSEFWYEVWWQKPLSPTFRFTVMVIWNISLGASMNKATCIFYDNLCTNNVCFQKCLLMLPPSNLTLNWSVGLI